MDLTFTKTLLFTGRNAVRVYFQVDVPCDGFYKLEVVLKAKYKEVHHADNIAENTRHTAMIIRNGCFTNTVANCVGYLQLPCDDFCLHLSLFTNGDRSMNCRLTYNHNSFVRELPKDFNLTLDLTISWIHMEESRVINKWCQDTSNSIVDKFEEFLDRPAGSGCRKAFEEAQALLS